MCRIQNSRAGIAICYSKLSWLLLKIEFRKQMSRTSCYSFPLHKIKNTICLKYYNILIATQLLQTETQLTICVAIFTQKLLINCTKLFCTLMSVCSVHSAKYALVMP